LKYFFVHTKAANDPVLYVVNCLLQDSVQSDSFTPSAVHCVGATSEYFVSVVTLSVLFCEFNTNTTRLSRVVTPKDGRPKVL